MIRSVSLAVGGWLVVVSAWAQVPTAAPAQIDTSVIRSAPPTVTDSIRVGTSELGVTSDSLATLAPADTAAVSPRASRAIERIKPRIATLRSLALPGLGQAYNRQYWKIPFVYAGLGVCAYFFNYYRVLAREAEDGYRLLLYGPLLEPGGVYSLDPATSSAVVTRPAYRPPVYGPKPESVVIGNGVFFSTQGAVRAYNGYRRFRDLNVFLFIGIWALNAVEANVAAHLRTFDLSEDISLNHTPTLIPTPIGPVPGLRLALNFKK